MKTVGGGWPLEPEVSAVFPRRVAAPQVARAGTGLVSGRIFATFRGTKQCCGGSEHHHGRTAHRWLAVVTFAASSSAILVPIPKITGPRGSVGGACAEAVLTLDVLATPAKPCDQPIDLRLSRIV